MICTVAALSGNLECLKWAVKNGCDRNKYICLDYAKEIGHNQMIEWIESK